jgi:hypothetical protein
MYLIAGFLVNGERFGLSSWTGTKREYGKDTRERARVQKSTIDGAGVFTPYISII